MDSTNIKWNKNMSFTAEIGGHFINLDTATEFGGDDTGPSPKPLILAALGGCTAIDLVSILKKMRVDFDSLNVRVDGELSNGHPKYYNGINIIYELTGKDINAESVKKAVSLSEEKYCGVSHMLRKILEINSLININGKSV